MALNNEEMLEVKGGSISSIYLSLGIIGGAIVFLSGVIDGIIHPKKC